MAQFHRGDSTALLSYRNTVCRCVPGDDKHMLPLQDAQRALGPRPLSCQGNGQPLIRSALASSDFPPAARLMAHLCNDYEEARAYEPCVDEADPGQLPSGLLPHGDLS